MHVNRNGAFGLLAVLAFGVALLLVLLVDDLVLDDDALEVFLGLIAGGLACLALGSHVPPRRHRA